MKMKIIHDNENLLVIDKPAGIVVFPEGNIKEKTLIDFLLERFPYLKKAGKAPRYGIVHRLDKDTSGILLVAKNNKTLKFLQKQFKEGKVEKKYLALVLGNVKTDRGTIENLVGRSPKDRKKQKVYLPNEPRSQGKRKAITEYKVLERFTLLNSCKANLTGFKDYSLLELKPKTGRKHQLRVQLSFWHHPIAGDKLYGFKKQSSPKALSRQFLHAYYLKIKLQNNKEKEFRADLPEDLTKILQTII